jgi:cytochrome c553
MGSNAMQALSSFFCQSNRRLLKRLLSILAFVLPTAASFGQDPGEMFETGVRPLFAANCIQCHNAKLRTAGLDLSTLPGIAAGGDSGPLVSKNNPEASRLLDVIGYHGKLKMPPGGKLPDAAIEKLTAWVKAGATLPDYKPAAAILVANAAASTQTTGVFSETRRKHWAFQTVGNYPPPTVKNEAWAQSPIDRFILAKLEAQGINPPKRADKLTLIRRAKYDLIGLPPTEEEIRDFLADDSGEAFARLVDKFLASPHYGEKWGRRWLDVARYAESCGVDDNDPYTDAWRYREYVIDAFNRDEPFNQMIQEQIAGDLMPSTDGSAVNVRGRVATGFLALGPKATVEMDKMKTAYDVIDEQIDTTSKAFLGLTVACARCHDHKFDPIATKDYYSMAAIFANTKTFANQRGDFFTERKSRLYMAPLVEQHSYEQYLAHQKKIAAKNMQATALLDNETWKYLEANLFPHFADYMVAAWKVQHAGAVVAEIAITEKLDPRILQAWVDYLDPKGGFRPHLQKWNQADGSNVVAVANEYAELFRKTAVNWGVLVAQWKVSVDSASAAGTELPKAPNIEYNSKTAFNDPSERFFVDIVIPAKMLNDRTSKDGPFVLPEKEQEKHLSDAARLQLDVLRKESDALTKSSPPKPPMANAVAEGPKTAQTVFIRGSYSNPGERVDPAVPLILRASAVRPIRQGSGRRELADFIANPSNPLTARVMVNRIWLGHFGEGLVRTPNNFGLMGEAPAHPELLDYLARQFVESGWSIKSMHRAMMLTSLYQSDSRITDEANRLDPANRLWSRFQRRRMTIEEMRDTWLGLAGSLELKMGGIFDQVDAEAGGRGRGMRGAASPRSFDISKRRTVYVGINRTAVATPMVLYDFVDSSTSAGDRPETIIAPQGLYLINNPFVAKNATAFADHLLQEKGVSDEERVRKAYRMAWQHEPDQTEITSALTYIRNFPTAKSGFGGWQSFCRILISANQFHYID